MSLSVGHMELDPEFRQLVFPQTSGKIFTEYFQTGSPSSSELANGAGSTIEKSDNADWEDVLMLTVDQPTQVFASLTNMDIH
jgi:hypothetical protein